MTKKQNFLTMMVVASALSFGVAVAQPPGQPQELTREQRREQYNKQMQERRDAGRNRSNQSQTKIQRGTSPSGGGQKTLQQQDRRNLTNKNLAGDKAPINQADTNAARNKQLEDMRNRRNLKTTDEKNVVEQTGDQVDTGKRNVDEARNKRLQDLRKTRDIKPTEDKNAIEQTGDPVDTDRRNVDEARNKRLQDLRKTRDIKPGDDKKTVEQTGDPVDTGRRNVDESRNKRLEDLRKTRDLKPRDDQKAIEQADDQVDKGTLNADQSRKQRLEELRKKQDGNRTSLEEMRKLRDGDTKKIDLSDKKDGLPTDRLPKVDRQKNQAEQQDRINKMREGRDKYRLPDAEKNKIFEEAKSGKLDRQSVNKLKNTADSDTLRKTMLDLRESRGSKDDIRKKYIETRRSDADMSQKLSRLDPKTKGSLVGANLDGLLRKDDPALKNIRRFDKEDALRRYGDVKLKDRQRLTEGQIDALRNGRVPDGIGRADWGDYRRMGRPLDNEFNINAGRDVNIFNTYNKTEINNYYLPPAYGGGGPPNWGSFNWNYWDGRNYYDHSWAVSLFVGVGHVRYGGWDGAVVGGGYYSYGWGWIDGCIDYGGCRIWVPGLWAPYTVTECCECEQWIEPVYETVWTGCCWETVQVDGGYFVPAPSSDCRTVTRYRWIPGHFQFSYCG